MPSLRTSRLSPSKEEVIDEFCILRYHIPGAFHYPLSCVHIQEKGEPEETGAALPLSYKARDRIHRQVHDKIRESSQASAVCHPSFRLYAHGINGMVLRQVHLSVSLINSASPRP